MDATLLRKMRFIFFHQLYFSTFLSTFLLFYFLLFYFSQKWDLFLPSALLFSPVRGRVTMGRWEAGARHGEVGGALVRLFWDSGNRSETVLGGGRVLLCYYGQQTLLELSNSYASTWNSTVLRGQIWILGETCKETKSENVLEIPTYLQGGTGSAV